MQELEIIQIPVLQDNYIYLLHAPQSGQTVCIDPAVSEPVLEVLRNRNWSLDAIWNTHHHGDHTGGNLDLKAQTGCRIVGYGPDAARIPGIDVRVEEGDSVAPGDTHAGVLCVPGHTLGHIAFYFPEVLIIDGSIPAERKAPALFIGDTLFAMGCGRLFEGTPEMMFESLAKLGGLPNETLVFCAHEYTEHNGSFALTLEPGNAALQERMAQVRRARAEDQPTVPFTLTEERATNPFLRPESPEIRKTLGMETASNLAVFSELRHRRNGW